MTNNFEKNSRYRISDFAGRVIANDNIAHAYIIEGDKTTDKIKEAKYFAAKILCPEASENLQVYGECNRCPVCNKIRHSNHEDVLYVGGDGGSVKDDDVLAIQKKLKTMPIGTRNIVIIDSCDKMTVRAQNRLLKTLEEPPGNSIIILLVENCENLLDTVNSRCVKLKLSGTEAEYDVVLMDEAQDLIEMVLKHTSFYKLKSKFEDITKKYNSVEELLDCMEITYRNILLENAGGISVYKEEELIESIYAIEKARKQIINGVSVVYSFRNLLLKIGG